MAFDPTINLGNVITLGVTIGGGFWAYHKWDMSMELRHQQNSNKIDGIDQKVDRLDKKIDTNNEDHKQQVNRVENKIDENTRTTHGVSSRVIETNNKIEKHIVADDILQREILRRLDKVDK